MYLCYWLISLIPILYGIEWEALQHKWPVVVLRKLFHLLAMILFIPVYLSDVRRNKKNPMMCEIILY
jgi:ABC-type Co2+ transport system permease subunit